MIYVFSWINSGTRRLGRPARPPFLLLYSGVLEGFHQFFDDLGGVSPFVGGGDVGL